MRHSRFRLAGLTLLVVAGAGLAAQQTPVFRSYVDLVTVDATVIDGDGNPIRGLTADDFRLQVDGEPRAVVSVQFVERGVIIDRAETRATTGATDVSSNELANDPRLVLIAVDQANIRRLEGRPSIRAAGRFLESLSPWDRVAVAPLNYDGDLEFTTNHVQARIDLEKLAGEGDPPLVQPTFNVGLSEALPIADGNRAILDLVTRRECGTSLEGAGRPPVNPTRIASETTADRAACPTQLEQEARAAAQYARTRANLSLNELLEMMRRLRTIDGPKTMVLLTEGLLAEPQMVDLTALGAAAHEARVTIYVLQLEVPVVDATVDQVSPSLMADLQLKADGLNRLAGVGGGALFHMVGSSPAPFERIARELSGYYLLAFEPRESDRDGAAHRIKVSLDRRGATLRAREAFRFERAAFEMTRMEQRIVDLLRSESVATELPLRAATFSYYEPESGKVRIIVGGETDSGDPAVSEVLFGYVLVDPAGVVQASLVEETSTRRFAATARVDPGVYTLKMAAIDRFGRPGSVPRAVLAGVADLPLPASELMLARNATRDGAPFDPVVETVSGDRVLAYLELYPPAGRSLATVDVVVSVRPAGDDTPVIANRFASLSNRQPGLATASVMLPIETLPNGRYFVQADIVDGGVTLGHMERAFTLAR